MDIIDIAQLPWDEVGSQSHRAGRIAFKHVFLGDPTAPDNYELMVARLDATYKTPRHRHPYEQVRLTLTGSFNISPGVQLEAGQVGYFPEGTYYGPQEVKDEATVLTLQGGGVSRLSFVGLDDIRAARARLAGRGTFGDGVFRQPGAEHRRNQDSYEAVWEEVNQRPLVYPRQRYQAPILMTPEHFEWSRCSDGVEERRLGTFTEREIRLSQRRVRAGHASAIGRSGALTLGYVQSGRGTIAGQDIGAGCALRLLTGEQHAFQPHEDAVMFLIELPPLP